MNRKINIALVLLLLTWAAGLCFSVSYAHQLYFESITVHKTSDQLEEHLTQEEQRKSAAWSEPTTPQGTAAHPDKNLQTLLFENATGKLYFPDQHCDLKTVKVAYAFASLSAQFRILPNAP